MTFVIKIYDCCQFLVQNSYIKYVIKQNINICSFELINYCGNDGDPLMASDIVPIINSVR